MSKIIQPVHEARDLPARISSYVTGFFMSVLVTLLAYFAVVNQFWTGWTLAIVIVVLAVIQLAIQLIFFLHLGHEKGGNWKLVTFWFATLVVAIVVVGSLWIMHNLNYNMMQMTPDEQIEYLKDNEGF